MNILVVFLAGLIPMVMGMLWYSKMLFGNAWMRINRFREEDMKGANMVVLFGGALVFSMMISFFLNAIVIHQFALYSLVGGEARTPADKEWLDATMKVYGNNFRTFKHGALHGAIAAVFFVLPILGIPALFERRGWKYILIHLGYWVVTLALMGGVLSQWNK
jgi:hypothetical protein